MRVAHAPGMPGTFPRHQLQRKLLVSDSGMHHGTCVTHVPWCMSGSLTRGGGENVIPGACATCNFANLVRGPYQYAKTVVFGLVIFASFIHFIPLQWCHNKRDGVWNHRRLGCLLNRLFRRRPKKTSKLHATGLCEGNSPVTSEFPHVFIWWHHHVLKVHVSSHKITWALFQVAFPTSNIILGIVCRQNAKL